MRQRNPKVCQGCQHLDGARDLCSLPHGLKDDGTLDFLMIKGMLESLIASGMLDSSCPRYLEQIVMSQKPILSRRKRKKCKGN